MMGPTATMMPRSVTSSGVRESVTGEATMKSCKVTAASKVTGASKVTASAKVTTASKVAAATSVAPAATSASERCIRRDRQYPGQQ
jgi:nucleoid-associated protein YgaU